MNRIAAGGRRPRHATRLMVHGGACACVVLVAAGCTVQGTGGGPCAPGDSDGVSGGTISVLVSASDTSFTVGGVDSGSTDPNVTVQNLSKVVLTMTNVGTRPHDIVVGCIPSGFPAGCAPTSCFAGPAAAVPGYVILVPALAPGQSRTVTIAAPAVEGSYPLLSDQPGDGKTADGGVSGPVGAFVLM